MDKIMLFTDNANRIIFWVVIPIIILFYCAFRIIEWKNLDDGNRAEIAKTHYQNVKRNYKINCPIIGGSNAVFSLSAQQMSVHEDLNCYNMSLLNEGYSDSAYFKFLDNAPLDKNGIDLFFIVLFIPYQITNISITD